MTFRRYGNHPAPGQRIEAAAPEQQIQRRQVEMPEPVLTDGIPYHLWTEAAIANANQWRLGGKFRVGLERPADPVYEIPPVPGSASDTRRSFMGTGAGEVWR